MRFTTIIASASVAAVLGLAGVSVAGAASNSGSGRQSAPTATASAAPAAGAAKARREEARRRAPPTDPPRRRCARGDQTIGITRPELRQELAAGKTIATIATEHGVQPQAVIDALESAATTKIDAAQAADKITAERGREAEDPPPHRDPQARERAGTRATSDASVAIAGRGPRRAAGGATRDLGRGL